VPRHSDSATAPVPDLATGYAPCVLTQRRDVPAKPTSANSSTHWNSSAEPALPHFASCSSFHRADRQAEQPKANALDRIAASPGLQGAGKGALTARSHLRFCRRTAAVSRLASSRIPLTPSISRAIRKGTRSPSGSSRSLFRHYSAHRSLPRCLPNLAWVLARLSLNWRRLTAWRAHLWALRSRPAWPCSRLA